MPKCNPVPAFVWFAIDWCAGDWMQQRIIFERPTCLPCVTRQTTSTTCPPVWDYWFTVDACRCAKVLDLSGPKLLCVCDPNGRVVSKRLSNVSILISLNNQSSCMVWQSNNYSAAFGKVEKIGCACLDTWQCYTDSWRL